MNDACRRIRVPPSGDPSVLYPPTPFTLIRESWVTVFPVINVPVESHTVPPPFVAFASESMAAWISTWSSTPSQT